MATIIMSFSPLFIARTMSLSGQTGLTWAGEDNARQCTRVRGAEKNCVFQINLVTWYQLQVKWMATKDPSAGGMVEMGEVMGVGWGGRWANGG